MVNTNPYEEVAELQRVLMIQKGIIHDQDEHLKNQEERLQKQEKAIYRLTKMMQQEVQQPEASQPQEEEQHQMASLNIIPLKLLLEGKY